MATTPTTAIQSPSSNALADALPTGVLMAAEAAAISELCANLAKQNMSRADMFEWAGSKGWSPADVMRWMDRIQGFLAQRAGADLEQIRYRLTARLARVANTAELDREYGDAVKATEAEARLHGLAVDAKSGPSVAIQINSPLSADQIKTLSDADIRARLARLDAQPQTDQPHDSQPAPAQAALKAEDLL